MHLMGDVLFVSKVKPTWPLCHVAISAVVQLARQVFRGLAILVLFVELLLFTQCISITVSISIDQIVESPRAVDKFLPSFCQLKDLYTVASDLNASTQFKLSPLCKKESKEKYQTLVFLCIIIKKSPIEYHCLEILELEHLNYQILNNSISHYSICSQRLSI